MLRIGKKVYLESCVMCHGIDAKGHGPLSKLKNSSLYPADLSKTLLNREQQIVYTKYGGKFWGSAEANMPSWRNEYDDFTLHSVILYIEEVLDKK
ncbi:cytochrome c [Sulfurimonas sp. MAG313]|nr:cytochrome c [Sulfurimonas sp. MAG313]MDF1882002.1 cytochrome c [Sulfurimonas sp. MAG313]